MTGTPQKYRTNMSWAQLIGALGIDMPALYAGSGGGFPASPAQGDLVYYNGTAWVALAPGTSGQFLETLGAGANPTWAAVSGGSAGNVTPDTHPAIPAGVGLGPNDEFEYGTSIDTTGARYAGATPWTVWGAAPTNAIVNGTLVVTEPTTGSNRINGWSQPVAAGSWTYTCKITTQWNATDSGSYVCMFVGSSGGTSSPSNSFGLDGGHILVGHNTNNTTAGTGPYSGSWFPLGTNLTVPPYLYPGAYLQIAFDGTFLYYSFSPVNDGVNFELLFSENAASNVITPAYIGIGAGTYGGGLVVQAPFDWFRRVA
jgi:hypothetical protein